MDSEYEVTKRAHELVRPHTKKEIDEAIIEARKLERSASTPPIRRSRLGAFYYTYIPRKSNESGSQMQYWDHLPEDNK